jgi:hypothetical protein
MREEDMGSSPKKITCAKCGHEDHVDMRVILDCPTSALDRRDIIALAQTVQDTGSVVAEQALDRVFVDEPTISEWIAQARCAVLRVSA